VETRSAYRVPSGILKNKFCAFLSGPIGGSILRNRGASYFSMLKRSLTAYGTRAYLRKLPTLGTPLALCRVYLRQFLRGTTFQMRCGDCAAAYRRLTARCSARLSAFAPSSSRYYMRDIPLPANPSHPALHSMPMTLQFTESSKRPSLLWQHLQRYLKTFAN
jgi:hypothetical protein